jgi:L-fuculose-phosphate aldolase
MAAAKSESAYRHDIVEVGRRIAQRGYVAANDGNISVRIDDSSILCTPTGVAKGYMTPDMIAKVDIASGRKLEGEFPISSETKMHLAVYKERPDVGAVVHAHPPYATGFAVAGIPLTRCVLPEVIISMGSIPLCVYGTPSTMEIPESMMSYIDKHDAFLLANHGALTVGADVFQALFRMESMEHFAHISFVARTLGKENVLNQEQFNKLVDVRKKFGLTDRYPGCECESCDACSLTPAEPAVSTANSGRQFSQDELVRIITEVTTQVLAARR